MKKEIIFVFISNLLAQIMGKSTDAGRLLSRKERHVIFPEGSSLSLAICMTQIMITPYKILSEGLNWGVTYDLPTNSSQFTNGLTRFRPEPILHRRRRRDLYQKLEVIMNSMGFSGRSCIFRALCETSRIFSDKSKESGVIEEILQAIFRFPQENFLSSEPDEHKLYDWAYRAGTTEKDIECADLYPQCSLSLINTFLHKFI